MGKIYKSITELVGRTPLVELSGYEKEKELYGKVLAKLEYLNPTGSIKDRAAFSMIRHAEEAGKIKPGDVIFDNTSGNTGIALAAFANAKGYRYECVLEPGVSEERLKILNAFGVHTIWNPDVPGFNEAMANGLSIEKFSQVMQKYADEKGYFYTNQLGNDDNPRAHYETTGPEIWEDTDGKVDIFVAMAGTGGTITGNAKYLREKNPDIKIVAVEPAPQSLPSAENPNPNKIDGVIPFDGLPDEAQPTFFNHGEFQFEYDEVIPIVTEDAYQTAHELAKTDGIFLGESAAAALLAATIVAKRPENKDKNIVVIFPDNGFKYLSTNMYNTSAESQN